MLEVERPLIEARLDLDECLNGQPDLQACAKPAPLACRDMLI
jgi:hypothetical protein